VRYSLVMLTKEGQDTKLAPEKFEMGRNFVNKLWNASRFVLSRAGRLPELPHELDGTVAVTALEDRWVLSRLAATIEAVSAAWERYDFNDAAQLLYRFTWNDVCDWYVEAVKPRLGGGPTAGDGAGGAAEPLAAAVLGRVLADLLALLHPVAPFVTEAVWQRLRVASAAHLAPVLLTARWPDGAGLRRDPRAEADLATAQAVVSSVRKLRQQSNVPERKPVRVTVALPDQAAVDGLRRAEELVLRLGMLQELTIGTDPPRPAGAAVDIGDGVEVLLDLDGLIDRAAQRADLQRNLEKVVKQLAAIAAKLGNEQFTARAPAELVAKERARLAELTAEQQRVEGLLAALGS